jgi:RNA polymerase sigma-70 factor (ECF subfamily)
MLRCGARDVDNLGAWLTTIVARVALNILRSRSARRELSYSAHLPDPLISPDGELQPEQEAMLADSVGLALLVVLESLSPKERLAFLVHDVFQLPFEEIAPIVGRIQGSEIPSPDPDRSRQRAVVDAFFSAARGGDFDGLLALLDPDIVLRADFGAKHLDRSVVIRGARPGWPGARLRARHSPAPAWSRCWSTKPPARLS